MKKKELTYNKLVKHLFTIEVENLEKALGNIFVLSKQMPIKETIIRPYVRGLHQEEEVYNELNQFFHFDNYKELSSMQILKIAYEVYNVKKWTFIENKEEAVLQKKMQFLSE